MQVQTIDRRTEQNVYWFDPKQIIIILTALTYMDEGCPTVLFYLALIYYYINTSTPGRRSSKLWQIQIYVNLFKCFEQTFASIFPGEKSYHANTMSLSRHHVDLHVSVFLKTVHSDKVHHRNECQAENGDVRRRGGPQTSYSILFSISIEVYRHVL